MGFCHSWNLKRDLTDKEWDVLCSATDALCAAMPEVVRRGVFREGHRKSLGDKVHDFLWKRRWRIPVVPSEGMGGRFHDENIISVSAEKGRVDFSYGDFVFDRHKGEGFSKTNAALNEYVAVGVLSLTSKLMGDDFVLLSSDGTPEFWASLSEWASEVLKERLLCPEIKGRNVSP